LTRARIHLQRSAASGADSNAGGQIHAISSCAWGERTITWNNQPAIDGPVLATAGAVALKQGVDFDITPAIHGDGIYCFAIDTASTDNVNYNSPEATTGKPWVALTAAPDRGCVQHVAGAHLQLQVANLTNSGSVTGGAIHAITNCSWNELTMTWNTQPAIEGPALMTLGAVAAGQIADFDVTPAIPGDGVYCFAIDTASTDSAIYNSREGSGL